MNRILIVEDEARLAAFVEKGLRRSGFKTTIAEDGEQAIRQAESGDFDLVLLDLGLPIKDGWTVLRELRDKGKAYPVIVVTAHSDDRNKGAVMKAGANDYVTKPFRFKDLLSRVVAHLAV